MRFNRRRLTIEVLSLVVIPRTSSHHKNRWSNWFPFKERPRKVQFNRFAKESARPPALKVSKVFANTTLLNDCLLCYPLHHLLGRPTVRPEPFDKWYLKSDHKWMVRRVLLIEYGTQLLLTTENSQKQWLRVADILSARIYWNQNWGMLKSMNKDKEYDRPTIRRCSLHYLPIAPRAVVTCKDMNLVQRRTDRAASSSTK